MACSALDLTAPSPSHLQRIGEELAPPPIRNPVWQLRDDHPPKPMQLFRSEEEYAEEE